MVPVNLVQFESINRLIPLTHEAAPTVFLENIGTFFLAFKNLIFSFLELLWLRKMIALLVVTTVVLVVTTHG